MRLPCMDCGRYINDPEDICDLCRGADLKCYPPFCPPLRAENTREIASQVVEKTEPGSPEMPDHGRQP